MKGMNGMKSAGVCGLWIMVGQCLVSTARGVWESDATLPASFWQLRIFLQVYAPIWRHLAYLDHLKVLVLFFAFFAPLFFFLCCFNDSKNPLWPSTKNGRWTTTQSLCYFLFCWRLAWTTHGWISTFFWCRIPPVDCCNLQMFFQQMSLQQITLMRAAWIMERLAMTCRACRFWYASYMII